MPDPVLTLLKYVFLAILYLFFLRVLRAVWVELREPRPAPLPVHPEPPTVVTGIPATPGPAPVPAAARGAGAPGAEKLVVVDPEGLRGHEFAIDGEATVGRAGGCAILLDADTFVSQLHARVFRRDGSIFVEDLGSTNGTYLNGRKVTSPVTVHKGDRVQFGRTTMEVRK